MLTLFAVPKAFRSTAAVIQRNAIWSWTQLQPKPEILLFGDEEGTAQLADELHAKHIPAVKRNEYGTPLINDVFQQAAERASTPLVAYLNADIVLLNGFLEAIDVVKTWDRFLIVGRRWDLDLIDSIENNLQWRAQLADKIKLKGILHDAKGIDYFVFPRRIDIQMPSFAIGRPAWDNWFLFRMRSLGVPIVDATERVTIVHQNHDYSHVPLREGPQWMGPEAVKNRELAGGERFAFSLDDATHVLTASGIHRASSYVHLRRRLDTFALLHPHLRPLEFISKKIIWLAGPLVRRIRGV
jgi:hypothetical protein